MTGPRSTLIKAGNHELHVTEWGKRGNPALVMWHGLARTGRDFDEIAKALSERWFVVCPDTLGRGLSSWANDATADYSYSAYGDHATAILDHYDIETTGWIGTSMGGLLGVTLAAGQLKERIDKLVVNDVGPTIPQEATSRIAAYVGSPPCFRSISELEGWLRQNYTSFGENSEAFWQRMRDTSFRRTDDGKITVHYDPLIATQFTHHRADLDCWPQWDTVTAKTLLLRGQTSDVLPLAVAQEMQNRGPRPPLVEVPHVGHAPTLASTFEINLISKFLLE